MIERINGQYWNTLSHFISHGVAPLKPEIHLSPTEKLVMAREYFQTGIVLFMNNLEKSGAEFLKVSRDILSNFSGTPGFEVDDYFRNYFISWLLEEVDNRDLLTRIQNELADRTLKKVISYGSMELYEELKKSAFHLIHPPSSKITETFDYKADDKYQYQVVADEIIKSARLWLLVGRSSNAEKSIKCAQRLYRSALNKIPAMLANENPKWKKFAAHSDAELGRIQDKSAAECLARRELLRGAIPLYRREGEVLLGLSRFGYSQTREREKELIRSKFRAFYEEMINPPNKKESVFGFIQELEWFLIRKTYYFRIEKEPISAMPGEVLRRLFG